MKKLFTIVALVAALSTSAPARTLDRPNNTQRIESSEAANARAQATFTNQYSGGAARDTALRDCSKQVQAYSEDDWGVGEAQIYRSCMSGHGQAE